MSEPSNEAAPLRVTHVTTVPLSLRFLRGQAAFMRKRGIELSAVSSPGPLLDAFGREEGVPVHGIPMARSITPLEDLKSLAALAAHFRALQPDIVHAHTPKGGLLGVLAATLAGVPRRIYHMRGLPLMGAEGWQAQLLWLTEKVSCTLATEVLCVSHSLRDEAIARGLVSPERIRVLLGGSGQGVDADHRFNPDLIGDATRKEVRAELGIPRDALVYGFVGRLVGDKGIVELVDAWAEVAAIAPDAHLLIIGDYESRDPVPERTRAGLAAAPRAHLVGFREDTERFYAAMDVVVLPTYREGFPNVPLEAASMGKPVVATRVAGCVDAVEDGVTGTLVEPRDAGALARAMLAYRETSLWEGHGQAGRRRVSSSFRREAIWAAIAERYERGTRAGSTRAGERAILRPRL